MESFMLTIKKEYTGKNILKKIISKLRRPKRLEVKWNKQDSEKFSKLFGKNFEEEILIMISNEITNEIINLSGEI